MRKIKIKNYTNASDFTVISLLALYYDHSNDKSFMFNNKLYTINIKTTMLGTTITIR